MKKHFAVSLLAASIFMVTGCQEKAETAAPAAPAAPQVQLEDEAQKQAYAIGASLSRYVSRTMAQQEELGVVLDKAIVLEGMKAGLAGEILMSDEDLQKTLQNLDEKVAALSEAKTAADAAAARAESVKYLEDNAKREGVITTESGLQYEVITAAEGDKPTAKDTVTVHYTGTLVDGTVFDSSVERGEPATFPLNRVIPGWTEGVQLMSPGAKYKFYIPSDLGYGDTGAGSIPPHATLTFEVELISIAGKEAPKKEEKAEEADSAKAEAKVEEKAEEKK